MVKFIFLWRYSPTRTWTASFWGFYITHTHPIGFLRTSDQPVAEVATFNNTQQTQETNIHALNGIRTRNTRNQAAADLRVWTHGHRDWLMVKLQLQLSRSLYRFAYWLRFVRSSKRVLCSLKRQNGLRAYRVSYSLRIESYLPDGKAVGVQG